MQTHKGLGKQGILPYCFILHIIINIRAAGDVHIFGLQVKLYIETSIQPITITLVPVGVETVCAPVSIDINSSVFH